MSLFYTLRITRSTKKVRLVSLFYATARAMITKAQKTAVSANRLREAREAKEPNRTAFAAGIGMPVVTLRSYETGRTPLPPEVATRLARSLGVSVNYLLANDLLETTSGATLVTTDTLPVVHVPIHGEAAGGLWLEGEDLPIDRETITIAPLSGYPEHAQYARKVVGNSVNKHIRDGEYAIFVKYDSFGRRLRDGMLVDCRRERAGLCEHTVKVLAGDRLMTASDDLDVQVALPLGHTDEDTIVTIAGIVIGASRRIL